MRILIGMTMMAAVALAPSMAAAQDAAKGEQVFAAQKCSMCHQIAGKGNKLSPLDGVGKTLSAADIKEWIVDPEGTAAKTKPAPTRKPPMKKKALSDEEVKTLVAYLATLKG